MHTDINTRHFIFRHVPEKYHPYILLARFDRPAGIWLLLLPCWFAIVLAAHGPFNMRPREWALMAAFGAGAVLMRAAGCIINDLWDRKLDAQVARTAQRPLAAGTVTTRQAARFLALLLGLSFLILLCMNLPTIILGIASLALVATYPLMKRVTWWPQAFLGLTFSWGALMGWTAVTGKVELAPFLLYIACIFWTLGYDTIYAHQDIEDDARIGIKSTARLFGDKSKVFVSVFYGIFIALLMAAKLWAFPSPLTLALIFVAGFAAWRLVQKWIPANPASSLEAFRKNVRLGLLLLCVLAI